MAIKAAVLLHVVESKIKKKKKKIRHFGNSRKVWSCFENVAFNDVAAGLFNISKWSKNAKKSSMYFCTALQLYLCICVCGGKIQWWVICCLGLSTYNIVLSNQWLAYGLYHVTQKVLAILLFMPQPLMIIRWQLIMKNPLPLHQVFSSLY